MLMDFLTRDGQSEYLYHRVLIQLVILKKKKKKKIFLPQ